MSRTSTRSSLTNSQLQQSNGAYTSSSMSHNKKRKKKNNRIRSQSIFGCCLTRQQTPPSFNAEFTSVPTAINTSIVHKLKPKQITDRTLSELYPPPSTPSSMLSPSTIPTVYSTRREPIILSKQQMVDATLSHRGFIKQKRISKTLQGEVMTVAHKPYYTQLLICGYLGEIAYPSNFMYDNVICDICYRYYNEEKVIKTADKSLHLQGITLSDNGRKIKVHENIVQEAQLMAMFMKHNPPKTMIKYYNFFFDEYNYYILMEKGGKGLLQFTVQCHKYIKSGVLSIKEWRKNVGLIFGKMVAFIDWLHNDMHCCNMDISLENIVVTTNTYIDEREGKIKNLDIRFIDFGLTQRFEKNDIECICNVFAGKTGYKAPEVYNKISFNAKKADVWSLAVSFFMLSIGSPPYKRPHLKDAAFRYVNAGKIDRLLHHWNLVHYVTNNQYDLMTRMLCVDPRKRLSIKEVIEHRWIKPYIFRKNVLNKNKKCSTPSIIESSTVRCETDICCMVEMS